MSNQILKNLEEKFLECAHCGVIFESEWSEEETLAEKERIWGNVPDEECETVCDDCFQQIMSRMGMSKQ